MSIESLVSTLTELPGHCRLDGADAGRDQLGVLAISGPDAGKFLQGQLTCDVLALSTGEQTFGASCTAQGRMRALFRVLRRDDDFLLLMPRAVVPLLLAALKKYAVFFKTQLNDASDDFQLWGLLGAAPYAGAFPLSSLPAAVSRQLLVTAAGVAPSPLPGQPLATWAWAGAELLAGEPAVYPETVEKLLPHHVNLPGVGGVSFTKGCYTGQEIVARMEYRGKIKTHLQLARSEFAGDIPPGTAVRSGEREVGEVIRSAFIGKHQRLLVTLADPAMTDSLQLALPEAPILELHH